MSPRLRTARTMTALTGLVAALALAGPAHAESVSRLDPADATASPSDLRGVTVNHAARRVYTSMRVTDLKTSFEERTSGATVYLDTGGSDGPDYALLLPFFTDSDWAVARVEDWRVVGGPLACPSSVRYLPEDNHVSTWVSRNCLRNPARVRVSIKMTDTHDGSHPVVDWFVKWRTSTRWLTSA